MIVLHKTEAFFSSSPSVRSLRRKVSVLAALLAAVLATAESLHAAAPGAVIEDSAIRKAIVGYIQAETAAAKGSLGVHVNDGIVMLSGTVESLMQKIQARRIAESVKGVRSVVDDLRVEPSARDDAAIAGDVRWNIGKLPPREGIDILVSVDGGVVTLSGTADSWVLSRMAVRKAMAVNGVAEVVNRIEVKPGPHREDQAIRRDIVGRLENDLYIDAAHIQVTVKDGRVNLAGTAQTAAQKRRAAENAWIAGVVEVDSRDLEVDRHGMGELRRPSLYVPKSDVEILKAVEDALRMDPRVNPHIPDVSVVNGAVILSGAVDTLYAKRAAVADARNTTGVWRVDDQLQLRYRAFPSDDAVKRLIVDVFRRDAELHAQNIEVSVADNHVTLTGSVKTRGHKVRAENIVSQIDGVLTVDNRIQTPPAVDRPDDAEISAAIGDELYWSPYVDSERLTVSVADGRAVLKGRVANRFVARIAVQNAFQGGARSVRTQLTLNDGSILAEIFETQPDAAWPDAAWWPHL